jgi:hypothetical protein
MKLRKLVSALLVGGAALSLSATALAYQLLGSTWSNPKAIKYYYATNFPSDLQTATNAGAGAWNSACPEVSIVSGSSSSGNVYMKSTYNSSSPYSGTTALNGSSGNISNASVTINTYYSNGYDSTKKKSLLGHELGHVLGLGESGDVWALMYPSDSERAYRGTSAPRDDDKSGISYLY